MQIIKDLNNVVVYAGEKFNLTNEKLIAEGFIDLSVNSKTHVMVEVDSLPLDFIGRAYSHDKQWIKTPYGESLHMGNKPIEDEPISLIQIDKRLKEIEFVLMEKV